MYVHSKNVRRPGLTLRIYGAIKSKLGFNGTLMRLMDGLIYACAEAAAHEVHSRSSKVSYNYRYVWTPTHKKKYKATKHQCKSCGDTEIRQGYRYCPMCGASIVWLDPENIISNLESRAL